MRIPIASLDQVVLHLKRPGLDQDRVRYYVEHPEEIRDVLVYEGDHGVRLVVDGYHRTEAARLLGWDELDAEVRPGSAWDATTYADHERPRRPWAQVERDEGQGG